MGERLIEISPDNVQARDKQGGTLLHVALRYGLALETVKAIVEAAGRDILTSVDNNLMTPVHVGSRHGADVDVIKYLVDLDNSVLTMRDCDETPLHKAARGGYLCHINYYMSGPSLSSITIRNNRGEIPVVIMAKRSKRNEIVHERKYGEEGKEMTQYTEAIWKMLLAHPESMSEGN